jgi:hypothetical protein
MSKYRGIILFRLTWTLYGNIDIFTCSPSVIYKNERKTRRYGHMSFKLENIVCAQTELCDGTRYIMRA